MDYVNLGNTGLRVSRAADISALLLDFFRDVDPNRGELGRCIRTQKR